jgi:hypothetical protein
MEGASLIISQIPLHIHLPRTQRTNPPRFAVPEHSVIATEKTSLLPPQTTLDRTTDNHHNPTINTTSIFTVHLTPKTINSLTTKTITPR